MYDRERNGARDMGQERPRPGTRIDPDPALETGYEWDEGGDDDHAAQLPNEGFPRGKMGRAHADDVVQALVGAEQQCPKNVQRPTRPQPAPRSRAVAGWAEGRRYRIGCRCHYLFMRSGHLVAIVRH